MWLPHQNPSAFGLFCCCFHQLGTFLKANKFCDAYKWFQLLAHLPDSLSSVHSCKVSIGRYLWESIASKSYILHKIYILVLGSRCTLVIYTQVFIYNVVIIHLTDAYATLNVQNWLPELHFFSFIAPSCERFGFFPMYACKWFLKNTIENTALLLSECIFQFWEKLSLG